jgi:hypothetical protein
MAQVERVGVDRAIPVDVRVIVATHHNLAELVKKGAFREDLYHCVYVFPLRLPPLRERSEDIPALVAHLAAQVACQNETDGSRKRSRRKPSPNCSAIPGPAAFASCATPWSVCCCWRRDRWTQRPCVWRCLARPRPNQPGKPPR